MPSVVMSRSVLAKGKHPAGTARAKAHYIAREESYGPAARKVAYIDRTEAYTVRDDLVHAEPPRNLPAWAPDAATFFSAAEQHERAGGVVLTEYKFDLPRGLDRAQQLTFTRDFIQLQLPHNPVSWALHEPQGLDGTPHPHVHMIFSARELDGIERSAETFFKRYNAAHPERGGARKSPALNQWNAPAREKQLYSDLANVHLDHAGLAHRYHPGSLASRGLQLQPEPKLLPSDSFAYHSTGEITKGMRTLRKHRAAMAPYRAAEARDAQEAWEQRTQQLGLTPGMAHAQALERIAAGRAYALTHAPQKMTAMELDAQAQQIQQQLDTLEAQRRQIDAQLALEQAHTRNGTQRSAHSLERCEEVLQGSLDTRQPARTDRPQDIPERAAAIRERTRTQTRARTRAGRGLDGLEEEETPGQGLRVRIFGHDREHDQGMGW